IKKSVGGMCMGDSIPIYTQAVKMYYYNLHYFTAIAEIGTSMALSKRGKRRYLKEYSKIC
ncbi:MAG TPA: hypothetical protein VFC44_25375, partial [Candidatus Saccharimonadales bacterium]|nr:hypothetical protein [Candidatus Saccharimonadales bacterium]